MKECKLRVSEVLQQHFLDAEEYPDSLEKIAAEAFSVLPLISRQEPRLGLHLARYSLCKPEECVTLKGLSQIFMMIVVLIDVLFIVFSRVMGGVAGRWFRFF